MDKWIRSKYEKKGDDGIINAPINMNHIECVGVEDEAVLFNSHDEMYSWVYKDNEKRDQEYEWIMNQLDTNTNEYEQTNRINP